MYISIVIPNFNGKDLLEKNLPFIIKAKENKKNNIKEIIIVDDASTDDSVNFLKENYKKIELIIHSQNKGFASSVNSGARVAKGDLVCLINTDVVVSKIFLETMSEDFADERVFAVSLHEEGFGHAIGKFINGFIIHEGKSESNKVESTFWASGGSGVFKRKIWKELKGMDNNLLPFYWEDLDLCYRAQKRGFKILWDPRAKVIHHHESTYKKLNKRYIERMKERNYLLFNWKNITSSIFFKRHIVSLIKKILKHPGYLRIVTLAITKLPIVLGEREKEVKETTISDEALFAKFQ